MMVHFDLVSTTTSQRTVYSVCVCVCVCARHKLDSYTRTAEERRGAQRGIGEEETRGKERGDTSISSDRSSWTPQVGSTKCFW